MTIIKQWKYWQKTFLLVFGPFLPIFFLFWLQKIVILVHFSHSTHRILLLFHVKTIFMIFYYDYLVKVLKKVCFAIFWPYRLKGMRSDPFFYPKIRLSYSTNISQRSFTELKKWLRRYLGFRRARYEDNRTSVI